MKWAFAGAPVVAKSFVERGSVIYERPSIGTNQSIPAWHESEHSWHTPLGVGLGFATKKEVP